jgi:hypothetical protein
VLYTCFSQAHDRFDPISNANHLIEALECAQAIMGKMDPTSNPSGKWVWFMDFHGYSLGDNNPRTTMLTVDLLNYYPERLGT